MTTARRLLVPLSALLLACGEAPLSVPEGPRPARVRLVELEPANVTAGGDEGAELTVRVETSFGSPVPKMQVRFLVGEGGGSALPGRDSTDTRGIARTLYLPGAASGTASLRVDVPAAPWVTPLRVDVGVVPTSRVRLSAAGGDGQQAEAGSQLPRPLRVRARTPGGTPAAGIRLAWRVAEGPGGSSLDRDTTLTGPEGESRALLDLGTEPGRHVVLVHPAPPAAGDTVRFTATGRDSIDSDVAVDSVRPRPLVGGEEAVVHGRGFGTDSAAVRVWIEGRRAEVRALSSGRARVRVPASDACLPDRRVSVRVEANGVPSNGLRAQAAGTGVELDPPPGSVRTVRIDGTEACVRGPGTEESRSYRVLLYGAGKEGTAVTPVHLALRTGSEGEARRTLPVPGAAGATETTATYGAEVSLPGADGRVSNAGSAGGAGPLRGAPGEWDRGEPDLRRRAREVLLARGAAPLRAGRPPAARAARTSAPSTGDTLRFSFPVSPGGAVSCTDTAAVVTGVVRARGPDALLVEDVSAAGRGFGEAEFRRLRHEFHEAVFPVDTAHFGPPADLDGNGRVVLLFTPEVNRLTPPGSEARIGGFFLPLDLATDGDPEDGIVGEGDIACPTSNEGEILYLSTADPGGEFGAEFPAEEALRSARAIAAHELEHLLSGEQRVVLGTGGFESLESIWLGEGLAHLAEEAVGLAVLGMEPGRNLGFDAFSGSRAALDVFNTFHLQNFGRLQLYLRAPHRAPVLAAVDPGGAAGLRMRGFAWLFARWLGDRFGHRSVPGLYRRLSVGGPSHLTGTANVEEAAGRAWPALVREFAALPVLDDAGAGGPEASQLDTWDLRSVYDGLRENPSAGRVFPFGYPFSPRPLPFEDRLVPVEIRAGAPAYFALSSARGAPPWAVAVAGADGGAPPGAAELHLAVIRIR